MPPFRTKTDRHFDESSRVFGGWRNHHAREALAHSGQHHHRQGAADLSDAGRGNHWGRTCNDSGGFRDANEPDASGRTDSPTLPITDSHPYGIPAANLVDPLALDQTCPYKALRTRSPRTRPR